MNDLGECAETYQSDTESHTVTGDRVELERLLAAIDKIHYADRYGCCANDGHSWPCPTACLLTDMVHCVMIAKWANLTN